jgi:hypothetical protein
MAEISDTTKPVSYNVLLDDSGMIMKIRATNRRRVMLGDEVLKDETSESDVDLAQASTIFGDAIAGQMAELTSARLELEDLRSKLDDYQPTKDRMNELARLYDQSQRDVSQRDAQIDRLLTQNADLDNARVRAEKGRDEIRSQLQSGADIAAVTEITR